MTRDYAKKNRPRAGTGGTRSRSTARGNSRKPARPQRPGTWQWLIVVAVTSAFVGFVVYLNAVPPEPPARALGTVGTPGTVGTQVQELPAKTTKSNGKEVSPVPVPQEPEYRFYEMLPESEVVTPEISVYNTGKGQRQQFEYVLQTGSFRTLGDAQRQKAQIGFQGLRADVSEVNLDSGDTWFRVQIGPYQSRSIMNSVIDRLVAINIQPLVRKKPLPTANPE